MLKKDLLGESEMPQKRLDQVIQSVTFLSPIVGGHLTFEGVTFSPSQKGHKELPGRCCCEVLKHRLIWTDLDHVVTRAVTRKMCLVSRVFDSSCLHPT